MSIVARLTKAFTLAAVLLCGTTVLLGLAGAEPAEERAAPREKPRERPRPAPPSGTPTVELASDSGHSRPQCRIYFGCPPLARVAAGTIQHSEVQ